MIDSHKKNLEYIEADRTALRVNSKNLTLRLRQFNILKYRFRKLSLRFGFSIPENFFGSGLAIVILVQL